MNPSASEPLVLRTALQAAGRRYTRQRRTIYDCLVGEAGHPSAEEIFERARKRDPRLSLATVYKALEAFEAGRLIRKLVGGDGVARFDARADDHYHLHCARTGRVEDLPTPFDPDLIDRLDPGLAVRLEAVGFRLTGYRLELVGYFESAEPDDRRGAADRR